MLTITPREEKAVTPNPFNPADGPVTVKISQPIVHAVVYDMTGQTVQNLSPIAGSESITWDGKSGDRTVAEGVYFCRVEGESGFRKIFAIVLKKKK